MNQDEIIKLAIEKGAVIHFGNEVYFLLDELEAYTKAVEEKIKMSMWIAFYNRS